MPTTHAPIVVIIFSLGAFSGRHSLPVIFCLWSLSLAVLLGWYLVRIPDCCHCS